MKRLKKESPTNAELEVLKILWEKKKASVREVHDIISVKKKCSYTTTLKIMQKMMDKKILTRKTEHQIHMYYPALEEKKVLHNSILHVINNFFKGSYAKLALHALGSASKDENLDELLEIVTKLKQQKK